MRSLVFAACLSTALLAFACNSGDDQQRADDEPVAEQPTADSTDEEAPEEAADDSTGEWSTEDLEGPLQPVHAMYAAIDDEDEEAFREVFVPEVQESIDQYGADKAMKAWTGGMDAEPGDVDPSKLEYEYGDHGSAVAVFYDGREIGTIQVKETEAGWRISEK